MGEIERDESVAGRRVEGFSDAQENSENLSGGARVLGGRKKDVEGLQKKKL